MKNTAALSLTSDSNGVVSGKLCVFFELTLTSVCPADFNAVLRARGLKKFAFMGPKSGLECSFPLTLGQLIAIASMAEDAGQVHFLQQLDAEYTLPPNFFNCAM